MARLEWGLSAPFDGIILRQGRLGVWGSILGLRAAHLREEIPEWKEGG